MSRARSGPGPIRTREASSPSKTAASPINPDKPPRLAEDGETLIVEALRRLVALEGVAGAAMFDGELDLDLGSYVIDMSARARRFVSAAVHLELAVVTA